MVHVSVDAVSGDEHVVALSDDTTAPTIARHFVARHLRGWPPDLIDRAVLAVSEIVTNALEHASTPRWIGVRLTGECALVRVGDGSRILPTMSSPSTEAPKGRGLRIVDLLSDRWGAHVNDRGKVVWMEFAAPVR
jgi:anti-sigma regulatory factor (Ser/Thr protein kinase)